MSRRPPHWLQLYRAVEAMRSRSTAPVDVVGCDCLGEKNGPREEYRFQTLLAAMLSAQTRDAKTAEAMCNLKRHGCNVNAIAALSVQDINRMISMVVYHNRKADYIKRTSETIRDLHKGVVPSDLRTLCALPGLGPKMAHLFLQAADGKVEGVVVDIHVHRIAHRFGWVSPQAVTPEETRAALESWLPRNYWSRINRLLVGFGQTVCRPHFPECGHCLAASLCPYAFKEQSKRQLAEQAKLTGQAKSHICDIEDLPSPKKRKLESTKPKN